MLLFTECLDHHPLLSNPSDFKVAVNLVRQILITFQSNDLLYGYDDIHTYMYIIDKLFKYQRLLLYTLRPIFHLIYWRNSQVPDASWNLA